MQRTKTTRSGFTLIELLVVIAIISVLVSLTAAAIQKVRERGREVQARADISQLDEAVALFKTKFGIYPPCYGSGPQNTFKLSTAYNTSDPEYAMLKQMFGRMGADNGLRRLQADGSPTPFNAAVTADAIPQANPVLLDPNQCMVFFLSGGIFTNYTGFSTNEQYPLAGPFGGSPVGPISRFNGGPFFAGFTPSRMVSRANFNEAYFISGNPTRLRFAGDVAVDPLREQPWYTDPWGSPYLFFSSIYGTSRDSYQPTNCVIGPWGGQYGPKDDGGGQLNSAGVSPFFTGTGTGKRFVNDKKVQIISGGRSKMVGPGGARTPGTGAYALSPSLRPPAFGWGGDDFSNFQQSPLGAPD